MHYGRFIASIPALTNNACAVYPTCTSAHSLYFGQVFGYWPISEASRFNAWVCGRSLAGITGSNPSGRIDVCLL